MKVETSWDDNSELNYKLALLLKKYRIPGTFYLPVNGIDWQFVEYLDSSGFEVGSHTITHPQDIKLLTSQEKQYEIQTSKELLESVYNKKVESICWPRGRYDNECLRIARESGYSYCRTTKIGTSELQTDFIHDTSAHVYNRSEYTPRGWYEYTMDILESNPKYFHLWGHAWEIERDSNWEKLERIFDRLNAKMYLYK